MPSASEMARVEEEAAPPTSDPYAELRARADKLGFPTVHDALDKLEELLRG